MSSFNRLIQRTPGRGPNKCRPNYFSSTKAFWCSASWNSAFRDKEVDITRGKTPSIDFLAENADEALKMAENAPPDLVVAGLDLENSDGLDFCRRLREMPQFTQVPLLVLTSTRNSVSDKEIQEVGAITNIEKPFKPIVFTEEVERIIAPSENVMEPESEGQSEPDSPPAMIVGDTAQDAPSLSEAATQKADETQQTPVAAEAPFALDSKTLAPIIQKHLEEAAEKDRPHVA